MSNNTQTNVHGKTIQRNIVFLITISLVLITSVAVIFPALIVRVASQIEYSPINPWDTGPLAIPLVLANIIFFGIVYVYKKNKLPALISRRINYIFDFEVSKKISFIVILVMLGIYIFFTINELGEIETGLDSPRVVEQAEKYS